MTEEVKRKRYRILYQSTVPVTLFRMFRHQLAYLHEKGFDLIGVSSRGAHLAHLSDEVRITISTVHMIRGISPLADIVALIRLARIYHRVRPALVHGHTPKGGFLAMVAATVTGVSCRVYTPHGLRYETARGLKRALLKYTERIACKLAHRVVGISQSMKDVLVRDGICPEKKIVLIQGETGVDCTEFRPSSNAPEVRREIRARLRMADSDIVFGFVGRIVRDKGIHELVRAWGKVRERREGVALLIVGDYEKTDSISDTAKAILDTDDRIYLTGWQEDMKSFLAAMDIFVLPTYREGFPFSIMEAAAMEIPVISTTATGSVDAVLDGETGILVPPGDAKELAQAMLYLIDRPDTRREMGKKGRARCLDEFEPRKIWEAHYQLYRLLLRWKLR